MNVLLLLVKLWVLSYLFLKPFTIQYCCTFLLWIFARANDVKWHKINDWYAVYVVYFLKYHRIAFYADLHGIRKFFWACLKSLRFFCLIKPLIPFILENNKIIFLLGILINHIKWGCEIKISPMYLHKGFFWLSANFAVVPELSCRAFRLKF